MSAVAKVEALTKDDRWTLRACIRAVRAVMCDVTEAAELLGEVCQKKLYRDDYGTFEAFCRAEFDMDRTHAYRLIRAGAVFETLANESFARARSAAPGLQKALPAPTQERQVRALTKLSKAQQTTAWEMAVDHAGGGQPTPHEVTFAAEIVAKQGVPPAAKPAPARAPEFFAGPIITMIDRLNTSDPVQAAALRLVATHTTQRLKTK